MIYVRYSRQKMEFILESDERHDANIRKQMESNFDRLRKSMEIEKEYVEIA